MVDQPPHHIPAGGLRRLFVKECPLWLNRTPDNSQFLLDIVMAIRVKALGAKPRRHELLANHTSRYMSRETNETRQTPH